MVVTVTSSRLDRDCGADFLNRLQEHVAPNTDTCVLDLGNVIFIDSRGIGALVSLLKLLGRQRRLEICNLRPPVQRVMRMTRLDQVFSIRPSLETALIATDVSLPFPAVPEFRSAR